MANLINVPNFLDLHHAVMFQFSNNPVIVQSGFPINGSGNLIWLPNSRPIASQLSLPAHLGRHLNSYAQPQEEFINRFINTPIFNAAIAGDQSAAAKIAAQIQELSGATIQLLATNQLQVNYPYSNMSAAAKAAFNAQNTTVYQNAINNIRTQYNPFTALSPEQFGKLPGFAEGGLPAELNGLQPETFPMPSPEELQNFGKVPGFAEGGLPAELTGSQPEIFPMPSPEELQNFGKVPGFGEGWIPPVSTVQTYEGLSPALTGQYNANVPLPADWNTRSVSSEQQNGGGAPQEEGLGSPDWVLPLAVLAAMTLPVEAAGAALYQGLRALVTQGVEQLAAAAASLGLTAAAAAAENAVPADQTTQEFLQTANDYAANSAVTQATLNMMEGLSGNPSSNTELTAEQAFQAEQAVQQNFFTPLPVDVQTAFDNATAVPTTTASIDDYNYVSAAAPYTPPTPDQNPAPDQPPPPDENPTPDQNPPTRRELRFWRRRRLAGHSRPVGQRHQDHAPVIVEHVLRHGQ